MYRLVNPDPSITNRRDNPSQLNSNGRIGVKSVVLIFFIVFLAIGTGLYWKRQTIRTTLEQMAQQTLAEKTGLAVRWESFEIGFFELIIQRADLTLPGSSTRLFIPELRIAYQPFHLLHKNVSVREISCVGPVLHVDVGTANAPASSRSPSNAVAPAAALALGFIPVPLEGPLRNGWTYTLHRWSAAEGMLAIRDAKPDGLNLTVERFSWEIDTHGNNERIGRLRIQSVEGSSYHISDIQAQWRIEATEDVRQVKGWLDLSYQSSRFQTNWQGKVVPFLRALEGSGFFKTGLSLGSTLLIDDVKARATIADGLMKITELKGSNREWGVSGRGIIDLASEALALELPVQASPTSLLGQLELTLDVGGTLSRPTVSLRDLKKKMFKATLNQLLQLPGVRKR